METKMNDVAFWITMGVVVIFLVTVIDPVAAATTSKSSSKKVGDSCLEGEREGEETHPMLREGGWRADAYARGMGLSQQNPWLYGD